MYVEEAALVFAVVFSYAPTIELFQGATLIVLAQQATQRRRKSHGSIAKVSQMM
jgi:hypothetical protein